MTTTSPPARPVPILMYHSVSTEATPAFHRFAIHPARFAEHMDYLATENYTTVTVRELTALRAAGAEIPPRTVALTFDDGFADFHDEVLPVLRRHGFTATLYVVTGFVGHTGRWLVDERESDRPLLSWSQLAEVAEAGVECGAHSHTHPQLDRIPLARAREELATSKALLEDRLQRAVDTFAFPFGFHSRRVRIAAREAGYRTACAVAELVSSDDNPYAVPRLTVSAGTDVSGLAALLLAGGRPSRAQKATVEAKRLLWQGIRRHGPAPLAAYLGNSRQAVNG
jgi:peptidoglycan/xylan/chitin deacetylase (PgdA/CDA1 family)